jgi:succinyl-diaminopimelate desuccinylase
VLTAADTITIDMSKKELLAAIDADKDAHVAFLQDFVRAPSPKPPGDTREAAEVLQRYLLRRGVETTVSAPRKEMSNVTSMLDALDHELRL